MNPRIKELYEQARLQAKSIDADLDPQGWMDLYHQKFAELIVRECADIAKHHVMNISTYGDAEFVDEQIREHFGVRE
jgi:hypothetical protein